MSKYSGLLNLGSMPTTWECSDGSRVTQGQIDTRYRLSREQKYSGITVTLMCECCGKERGNDNDHTISQSRCKKIHKTELIWHQGNYVWSCRKCHQEWENFKSGKWIEHKNAEERLRFMKEHDPDGYNIRINLTRMYLESE